jgi:hypothetical protein
MNDNELVHVGDIFIKNDSGDIYKVKEILNGEIFPDDPFFKVVSLIDNPEQDISGGFTLFQAREAKLQLYKPASF